MSFTKKSLFVVLTLTLVLLAGIMVPERVNAAPTYSIPGQVEAEGYSAMFGIQTEVCSEGTQNVGWIDAGDWMDYSVNVNTAGLYRVEYRVASINTTGKVDLRSGSAVLASTTVPNTGGWQAWYTVTANNVNLSAGFQTLRIYASGGGWNLNWFRFTATANPTPTPVSTNLALNQPAVVSSVENTSYPASAAFDGNAGTRWASAFSDPQWIYVDLGSSKTVNRVVLNWEAAYAGAYQLQVSNSTSGWTTVYTTTTGNGGIDDITFTATTARYVRMYGSIRATTYGYSLWEFEIYGSGPVVTATPTPTPISTTINAFAQIEAENFNSQTGIQTEPCSDSGGGQNIGYIQNGDYIAFWNVDFGGGAYGFNARVASANTGGNIEIRLDGIAGTLVGTCAVSGTGGWQTWTTQNCSVNGAGGIHNLYLRFTGGATDLMNVNWFKFSATSVSPTPTPAGENMEIMTWVPSYGQSVWKNALNANTGGAYNPRNTLTRLAGQFFQIQANGTTIQGVPDSDVQWVVNYCKTNGIKFLICTHNYLNGWNWQVAASAFANNRTALINHLVGLVNKWGAAGVDIDFEGNEAGDPYRNEFGLFIRELGARLHSMGKELTVDTFPYIWNQPNSNWWRDWVGYVDGVNSMGYNELFGGGPDWQSYRWQQDAALNAGYKNYQFQMGMPGWLGDWGYGGLGTNVSAHVNELLSGNYNRQPTSVCIWDAQFDGAGWLSAEVWNRLHQIRMLKGNSF